METQYGPSSNRRRKSIIKQQLIRNLFGTDSECEEKQTNKVNKKLSVNQYKARQSLEAQLQKELHSLTDSESEDVLQITIDNDHFDTPGKAQHTQQSTVISPVAKTSNDTHTLATPSKHTNTNKGSLTSTVENILHRTIQHIKFVSPIQKTPPHNARSCQSITPIKANPMHTHTSSKAIQPIHTKIARNGTKPLVHRSQAQQQHTHTSKNQAPNRFAHAHNSKRTANPIARYQPYPAISHTHAPKHNQPFHSHTYTSISSTRIPKQIQSFASHTLTSNARIHAHNQVASSSSSVCSQTLPKHQHNNNKHVESTIEHIPNERTQAHNHIASSSQSVCIQTLPSHPNKNKNIAPNELVTPPLVPPSTTYVHTHTPTQASTFKHESLTITIPNTAQLNTNSKKQANFEEPQKLNSISNPPKTKIITLNNKYAPKGVHLAIAVEKNQKLSKNALKKITRNLAAQL